LSSREAETQPHKSEKRDLICAEIDNLQVNTLTESWVIEEVIGIVDQMYPELLIDILTKNQKITRDCQRVAKMFPLLRGDKKLSIDDFLTIQSDQDNIEQLRQQLK